MKELIYNEAIHVLYMMKTYNIRFLYRLNKNFSWGDVRIIDALKYIENGRGGYAKGTEFKVHPDDVHRYTKESIDDTLILNEHGESVAWLAPSEIREV